MKGWRVRLLLVALTLAAAACGSDGTAPTDRAERLRVAITLAGTWVKVQSGPETEPLLSSGHILADTLRFGADGAGTWTIVSDQPGLTPAEMTGDIEWEVGEPGIHVIPRCGPPESLCLSAPPWIGNLDESRLALQPDFITQQPTVRIYEKVVP